MVVLIIIKDERSNIMLANITYHIQLKLCIILFRVYMQTFRIIACSLPLINILAALLMWINMGFIYKVYKLLKIGYSMVLILPSVLHMLFLVIAT